MEKTANIDKGLENVNIKWTKLTYIDGNNGILKYGGYNVNDLIENGAKEDEIQYLFLYGELPNRLDLELFQSKVQKGYELPDFVKDIIFELPRESDAVALQMAAFSALATSTYNFKWNADLDRDQAAKAIGLMSAVTANVYRHIMGKGPVDLEPSDSFAESFLRSTLDRTPSEDEIDAMNAALILYTDHEVPASTTAGLVAVSTLSDMYSGIAAALAALKGPLHGGAAEASIMQFQEIGDPDNVDAWFRDNIVNGNKRLMGFGHRVYKTYDPRARIFRRYAEKLSANDPEAKKMFDIATRLEKIGIDTFGSKKIYPNTDYFSGIVYLALGYPLRNNIYTSFFALSRVTGWISHFMEYVENQHRLIRPRAVYVGPEDLQFVKIEERRGPIITS